MFKTARFILGCLVIVGAAAAGVPVPAPTLVERLDLKTTSLFKVGAFSPTGKALREEFGTRNPIGLEARARSRYGYGASASACLWWATHDERLSTMVPLTLSATYARPYLDSAVVPFGGLFLAYNIGRLHFADEDTIAVASGSGVTGGFTGGAEVPLVDKFSLVAEFGLTLGRIPMEFDVDTRQFARGRHEIVLSGWNASLGINLGFSDLCLW